MNSQSMATRHMNVKTTVLGGFCSAVAIALRLLINAVRIPNFNPIGGLGVAQGAKQPLWLAGLWSLVAIAGSDIVLGAMRGFPSDHFLLAPFVYPSMLVYVLLGRTLAKDGQSWRLGLASFLGSLQFFIVTNFGSWLHYKELYSALYAPGWTGLGLAYVAGIPFLGLTMLGDLTFTAAFTGLHALAEKSVEKEATEAV